jgi:hypothetical protein
MVGDFDVLIDHVGTDSPSVKAFGLGKKSEWGKWYTSSTYGQTNCQNYHAQPSNDH